MPAYTVLTSMISVSVVAHMTRLYCLKRNYRYFSVSDYILKFSLPYILFALVSFAAAFLLHRVIGIVAVRFVAVLVVPALILSAFVYLAGLTVAEKAYVNKLISKILKPKRRNLH